MSRPRRLFCATLPDAGGEVALDADAARHARVLRLGPGDPVILFDGRGREAEGALVSDALAEVGAPRPAADEGPDLVLCQALPKGSKLDAIVRAATEVGVREIHLVEAARSVARPDAERFDRRRVRLEKVAREAARQAGRADVPILVAPASLSEVLGRAPAAAARFVTVVGAEDAPRAEAREAWVLVGPEGGLTDREVEAARQAGFRPASLGPHTLRVETAAPVALAIARERLRRPGD